MPVDSVVSLIELTARHGKLEPADVDRDAALFLDSDMAIFGVPPDRYDLCERSIAMEYAALPVEIYRAGRRAFLAHLLERPRIYLSDFFHERMGRSARSNIARAINAL